MFPFRLQNKSSKTKMVHQACSIWSPVTWPSTATDITTIYQKRWKVEEYHKSLKQNVSLAKSPTRTRVSQSNHLFAALCAYIKLESLKLKTRRNHFALKTKIYFSALRSAFEQLQQMKPCSFDNNASA